MTTILKKICRPITRPHHDLLTILVTLFKLNYAVNGISGGSVCVCAYDIAQVFSVSIRISVSVLWVHKRMCEQYKNTVMAAESIKVALKVHYTYNTDLYICACVIIHRWYSWNGTFSLSSFQNLHSLSLK